MKAIKILILGLIMTSFSTQSQIKVNFGTPPVWAPADRVATQYYYLPEIDSYYDVPTSQFIYVRKGAWYRSKALPARYKAYNLKSARVIYLTDYKGNKPYFYHKDHKIKYYKKSNIYVVKSKKGNGHYKEKEDYHENGHGKGHEKGHGKGHKD